MKLQISGHLDGLILTKGLHAGLEDSPAGFPIDRNGEVVTW